MLHNPATDALNEVRKHFATRLRPPAIAWFALAWVIKPAPL